MLGALAGSAHVNLSANVAGFRRDMAAADREFSRVTRRMELGSRSTGIQVARGLGFAILGSIGPMYLLGKAVRASFEELELIRREMAQTEAVIQSTGGVANVTAKHVHDLAAELLELSGVDDMLIARGENVLLTFTKVRNEVGAGNKIFDEATRAVLDMSVALDDDMQAAAIRVGRALQDPVYGITALRRVGVNFTREQQDMVSQLVATGRTLEAQKFILAELQTEFGGSAAAAGREFPAALSRAREAALDVGAAYLQTLIPAIQDAAEWLREQADAFGENTERQEEFRDAIVGIAEFLIDLGEGANAVADALGGWESTIKILIALKFASMLLGWTRAMRGYTGATWGAVAATSALALAQGAVGATGGGLIINPRTGRPFPPSGGPGRAGGLGRTVGRFGRFVPSPAAVAVGTAIAITQIPGASGGGGAKDLDDYPFLVSIWHKGASGLPLSKEERAVLKMLDPKRALSRQDEDVLERAEAKARAIATKGVARLRGADAHERQPAPGARPARPDPKVPSTELTIGTQQRLAEAERTESDVDDLRALERGRQELVRLLKQRNLTEEDRLKLTTALGAVERQIRSIHEARASEAERDKAERERAAEERRQEAEEARQEAHEQRVWQLERAVNRAAESAGVQDDLKRLIALRDYYRRWRDQQKRGTDEWRQAQEDVDDVNARIANVHRSERDRRQGIKRWRLERAVRLAEETEGVKDDLKALANLRAELLRVRREQRRYSDEWFSTQDDLDEINARIRQARKGRTDATRADRTLDSEFFAGEIRRILEELAPNFFPAEGADAGAVERLSRPGSPAFRGRAVQVHQHFPTAPTDYHREGRWAAAAIGASFDG